ncbi:MAG TPA: FAD-dependent oxidoreductase, partial [Methylomirabilota bacterium]|nr:FAD-dependent oxidoreductase [Methylomirabilota bacterium]
GAGQLLTFAGAVRDLDGTLVVTGESDVLVIGGGIAGVSAAYHLAGLGRRVTLLERGEIASGASGVNAGQIDSIGWGDKPDLQAHLTTGSLEIFKTVQLDHGEDIEFRQSGALQAIHTEEQAAFERERVRTLRERGHQVELLTNREVRGLEPQWSARLLGAMYSPERSQADPRKATRAFAALAAGRGARVLTQREVTALAPRASGGWLASTSGGELAAASLVIAAGAWCGPVGALLGLDIPIVPVRGQMWATAPVAPSVFQTMSSAESALAWHRDPGSEPPFLTSRKGARLTRHLYGRQRRDGEIIFGGDRDLAGWSTTPDPAGVDVNRGHAIEVLPFLAGLPIVKSWAGLMPFPLDGKPLIGRIPQRPDLWIVGGLASSGFGRGPMAGKLLADYLHTGRPAAVLAEADPARCVAERH